MSISLFKSTGKNTAVPFIFIETKRRGHSLEDALAQVKSYMSNCHLCDYGAATDGRAFVVIDKKFKACQDLPVFRNIWGLSNTIRYAYANIKTGITTTYCCDPNQPDSIELEVQGDCEFIDTDQLEKIPVYGKIAAGQPITMNARTGSRISTFPKNGSAGAVTSS